MREQRFSVAGHGQMQVSQTVLKLEKSPIIFSSERRGISHVSPDSSRASEKLLYNLKIYRLQRIKEFEGQIKRWWKVNLVFLRADCAWNFIHVQCDESESVTLTFTNFTALRKYLCFS